MSPLTFAVGLILVVWGFVCLLALVVLCACWICKREDERTDNELAWARRRRRSQEREALSRLRPDSGLVAASPRRLLAADFDKTPRRRSHGPGLDR